MNDIAAVEQKEETPVIIRQMLEGQYGAAEDKNAMLQACVERLTELDEPMGAIKKIRNPAELTPEQTALKDKAKAYNDFVLAHRQIVMLTPEHVSEALLARISEKDTVNHAPPSAIRGRLMTGNRRILLMVAGEEGVAPNERNTLASLFIHLKKCPEADAKIPDAVLEHDLDNILFANATNLDRGDKVSPTFYSVNAFNLGSTRGVADRMIADSQRKLTEILASEGVTIVGQTTLSPPTGIEQQLEKRLNDTKKGRFFPEKVRKHLISIGEKSEYAISDAAKGDANRIFLELLKKDAADMINSPDWPAIREIAEGAALKIIVEARDNDRHSLLPVANMHMTGRQDGKGGAYVAALEAGGGTASFDEHGNVARHTLARSLMTNFRYDDMCETHAPGGHTHERGAKYAKDGEIRLSLALTEKYDDWETQLAGEEKRQPVMAFERGINIPLAEHSWTSRAETTNMMRQQAR